MKMLIAMLMVAAISFCSHQQVAVASEVVVVVDGDRGNEVEILPFWPIRWPWCPPSPPPPSPLASATDCSTSDKKKILTCMFDEPSIDKCCPTFKSILGTSCPCYKYAEKVDNLKLITIDGYCDIVTPCKSVQSD
ncbi:hypothetical protein HAX54_023872 [Datura stramonium]|uniref:Bifunctional inhibitor/plant lipid transfer protein/seed storage helical domain-containing protein n=1 Tax=Datura stramonium TaxID=4076 RepID=A0ABS8RKH2_DATST|nr:hypothetical protein [Datura stramonium]